MNVVKLLLSKYDLRFSLPGLWSIFIDKLPHKENEKHRKHKQQPGKYQRVNWDPDDNGDRHIYDGADDCIYSTLDFDRCRKRLEKIVK